MIGRRERKEHKEDFFLFAFLVFFVVENAL